MSTTRSNTGPVVTSGFSDAPPDVMANWGGSIQGRPIPGVNQPRNTEPVSFFLDGDEITAEPGETILDAAKRHGAEIPHLCFTEGMRADGNCRACMVEIDGERVLAPSCCRAPTPGMSVKARSDRARHSQRTVLELLLADTPKTPHTPDSELSIWARRMGLERSRFPARHQPEPDFSHPAMAVRLDACIQCTRCIRACREVQVNDVIGYAGRGADARIVFDLDDPMGQSSCVGCGECVQACPTGALMEVGQGLGSNGNATAQPSGNGKRQNAAQAPAPARPAAGGVTRTVPSLCPYCGVGCQTHFHVEDNRIVNVTGRSGPANWGRLCVKGRFGMDYVRHPQRLQVPLVRREGVAKDAVNLVDPGNPRDVFREATWEEALELAAGGLRRTRDTHGPSAMAGFGSAKGSNEEAYLFQKLIRTGFRTNNVDHCTRLCHASSVAALMECISSGAVSNQVSDVQYADCFMVIGSNPTVNHPVAATFMKNAIERGAKLILIDPRRTEMARLATHTLQFNPDTDVALLNAMMHTIVTEDLVDRDFIERRTHGFDDIVRTVKAYSPEAMEHITGVPAETIREAARLYATSKTSMIFWGMGISQHVHGTDNARCLISLALMTGQVGRRGTGLHPLRGQNNVQGASDMGLIPMFYPDYKSCNDAGMKARFEELWDFEGLDPKAGLTVVEIMKAAKRGDIRAMYIMGENPAMSDPDVQQVRKGLANLDWLVVQDLFLTETASFADVVLPASAFPEKTGTFTNTDRRVQLGRQALELPGQARQDLWITQQLARGLGLDWSYEGARDVWREIRRAVPSCAGITWERLEADSSVTYPCREEGDPGEEVIFAERFPTADGRGRMVPAEYGDAEGDEPPDDEYPFVLITGRVLEHWHTGAMTRRATVLDEIEPVPTVSIHPDDLTALALADGDAARLTTRRGTVVAQARSDIAIPKGAVFMPFAFVEAAANTLTNPALDPFGKIPEFKYCGVRVEKSDRPVSAAPYGIAGGAAGD